jgi:hypothetical protein
MLSTTGTVVHVQSHTVRPYTVVQLTLLPWLWHLLGAQPAGRKSAIVWSPSVFSRRFRGGCRNPDEVHGTLMADGDGSAAISHTLLSRTPIQIKKCQLFREIGLPVIPVLPA